MSLFLTWPVLGAGFPPGVDTPTFLHLSWVTRQAIEGNLDNPFVDPYWYGGFPYLRSYPPLGYGLVGAASALTRIDLITVYRIALVVALASLGIATYFMSLELGLRRWVAALTGVITLIAYPVLASVYFWGWFTTVAALPFAILAYVLLERSLRQGKVWLAGLGGLCLALSVLVHHMTGFALVLGLSGWFLFHLLARVYSWQNLVRHSAVGIAVAGLVSLPWSLPFLTYWLDIGFDRIVPGNWVFPLNEYRRSISAAHLIGSYFYPAYFGSVLVPLGLTGAVYALLSKRLFGGPAIILLVLLWFTLGTQGNPLLNYSPFSGLDVARFQLYAVPFLALMVGILVNGAINLLETHRPILSGRVVTVAVVALMVGGLMVLPLRDALKARDLASPFRVDASVQQALDWLSEGSSPASLEDRRVFALGFWTWAAFLVPYETGEYLADGWHDEGDRHWATVRKLRLMAFSGQVDAEAAHQTLVQLGTRYVLVYDWYPYQHPWVFQQVFEANPRLFAKRAQWGKVSAFELLRP